MAACTAAHRVDGVQSRERQRLPGPIVDEISTHVPPQGAIDTDAQEPVHGQPLEGMLPREPVQVVRLVLGWDIAPDGLSAPAVLASAAYLERLNAPTPRSQRIMPVLGNFARGGGKVAAEFGQGHGCVLAAIKLDRLPEYADGDKLANIATSDRIIAARLLETDIDRTCIATREKGMRAGDRIFAGLMLIEGLDERAVSTAVDHHGFAPPSELYAEIFSL
jgi:hypothetical protein